jgi:hypothetical protein
MGEAYGRGLGRKTKREETVSNTQPYLGKKKLKNYLKKQCGRVRSGLIWLRVGDRWAGLADMATDLTQECTIHYKLEQTLF